VLTTPETAAVHRLSDTHTRMHAHSTQSTQSTQSTRHTAHGTWHTAHMHTCTHTVTDARTRTCVVVLWVECSLSGEHNSSIVRTRCDDDSEWTNLYW